MTDKTRVDASVLHQRAQSAVLDAILRGDDVDAAVAAVAPYDVRGRFTPDVAMLELAVDALDLADTPGSDRSGTKACASATSRRSSSRVGRSSGRVTTPSTPPPASAADFDPTCSTTPAGGTPPVDLRHLRPDHLHPSRRRTTCHQAAGSRHAHRPAPPRTGPDVTRKADSGGYLPAAP